MLITWYLALPVIPFLNWAAAGVQEGIPMVKHYQYRWISASDIITVEPLASGSYGQVFRGMYKGREVAIKQPTVSRLFVKFQLPQSLPTST